MSTDPRGFPARFPVRDDDRRPLRYRTAALLARLYLRLVWRGRLRIVGQEIIPSDGPLLVVSNHVSNLDPMVFGGHFPLTLFALAKRELYANRAAAWFLGGCNCIPVDRGRGDRRAVTRALAVLGARGRLLIFLEGTRSRDGTMQRAEPGVGFLARRSGATVLPAALTGTDGRDERGATRQAVLRYGKPVTLDLTGRRDDAAIADEIGALIAALLPAWRRGVYASGGDEDSPGVPPARSRPEGSSAPA